MRQGPPLPPLLKPDLQAAPAPDRDVLRGRLGMNDTGRRILLGRLLGAFGIRGESKLESWTEPRAAIFRYQPWIVRDPQGQERELSGVVGRETGKFLIATLPGITHRDVVEAMRGSEIYVPRSALH